MATRSTISVHGTDTAIHIYRHWDGYPSAVIPDLYSALSFAWPLPRFEADEFAAAIVCSMKTKPGNIRICSEPNSSFDRSYHYDILGAGSGDLRLRVTKTGVSFGEEAATGTIIFEGGLASALGMQWER